MATTVERVAVHQDGHWSSRSISILAALAVDAGLVWLLFLRAKYNPPVGEAELFWVRVVAAFGFYAVLQQWTLPIKPAEATTSLPLSTSSLPPAR
jgi:hypothetical protein